MPDMWLENIFPMYTPLLSITFTRSFNRTKVSLIFMSSNLSSFPFIGLSNGIKSKNSFLRNPEGVL